MTDRHPTVKPVLGDRTAEDLRDPGQQPVASVWDRLRAHLRTPLFATAYALIVNTGATALLGFAYWVAAARLYDVSAVGLASAAIAAMTLLAGLAQLNLEAVLVRFLPITGTGIRRLVRTVYLLCIALAVGVGLLFLFSLKWWAPSLGFLQTSEWNVWFVAGIVVWVIFVLQDGVLVGLGKAVWVPIGNIVFGAGKLIVLLLLADDGNPLSIFVSWTAPLLLVVVLMTALIFLRLIPSHIRQVEGSAPHYAIGEAVRYASGDYVGAMFELGSISLLPLLITWTAGPEETAYFYQGWIIAYTLILVSHNMTRSLMVEATRDQAQLMPYGRLVFRHMLGLLVPAVIVLVFAAPLLLSVSGPAYAAGGTRTLRWLALAALPHAVVLLALASARVKQRVGEVIVIQAITSAFVFGFSLVLTPRLGGEGAAIGWLVSQIIVAAALLATRLRWLVRIPTTTSGQVGV